MKGWKQCKLSWRSQRPSQALPHPRPQAALSEITKEKAEWDSANGCQGHLKNFEPKSEYCGGQFSSVLGMTLGPAARKDLPRVLPPASCAVAWNPCQGRSPFSQAVTILTLACVFRRQASGTGGKTGPQELREVEQNKSAQSSCWTD